MDQLGLLRALPAPQVTEAVCELLQQSAMALRAIRSGLRTHQTALFLTAIFAPWDDTCPTLTFNTIGRHQSQLVRTSADPRCRHTSKARSAHIHTITKHTRRGRFVASDELLETLKSNGQIATQYIDATGTWGMDLSVNPNGSVLAIEGTLSRWSSWQDGPRSAPVRNTRTSPSSPPATVLFLTHRGRRRVLQQGALAAAISARYPFPYGYRVSVRIRC